MNRIIDRDSDEMRSFSKFLDYFCEEMDFYCSDLHCNCSAAAEMMKDATGIQALSIISGLAEDIIVQEYAAGELSGRIKKSAELVEISDECI